MGSKDNRQYLRAPTGARFAQGQPTKAQGRYRDPREEPREKNTKCAACGRIGHWRGDAASEKNKNTESHRSDKIEGTVSLNCSFSLERGRANESVSFRDRGRDSVATPEWREWIPKRGLLVKLKKHRTTSASHNVKHAMYAAVVA